MRGGIQRTSYQEPVVPDILAGGNAFPQKPVQQPPAQTEPARSNMTPSVKTLADYSKALGIKTTPIRNTQQSSESELVARETERLRELDQQRRAARMMQAPAVSKFPQTTATTQSPVNVPVNAAPIAAPRQQPTGIAPATKLPTVDDQQRKMVTQSAANRIAEQNQMASQAAAEVPLEANSGVSATQFVADINQRQTVQDKTIQSNSSASPRLVAKQGESPVSPAMQLAAEPQPIQSTGLRDNQLKPASVNTETKQAVVQLAAPAISVTTQGPETIGVNKPAQYQVVVQNNSVIDADRILVGIDLPSWVDIQNVTLTSGGKEITDGNSQARLVWSVDQIQGNSKQILTVTAIPRKAEMFDVGVEWTLVPRTGKTNIRVTEPKLEMSISGPKEVLYGETALYHVSVRNPGTGAAEQVSVMLPEALGGERQSLGEIPAGKERNFQIELLARTAGDLNLVATATADGNLKTSAERALTVRRANLQVAMVGPAIRYAGDSGKYTVKISNTGDATATELVTAVALPPGVKYLEGIEAVKLIQGGMRWPVGSLAPGQTRTYSMVCQLDTSGELQLEVGARGKGDLAASGACLTTVETIADLVLTVTDLKGPLPTGKQVPYTIKVRNRGTKAAQNVSLTMQFSEGVEPKSAKGLQHQIKTGQVEFAQITQIDPGQEITLQVDAVAYKGGTHIFRAHLNSENSDVHEIAEGTTRFYGDTIQSPAASTANSNTFEVKEL